jgi:hypothetical protein
MKSTVGMVALTRTKTQIEKTLSDSHAAAILHMTMTTFINVDMRFHVGMQNLGEICHNFLHKADEKLQRKWIAAICEFQQIPTIEFDSRKPRTSLALALFAKYPEMQQQIKNGKDTKGAMRISNYLTAYADSISKPKKLKAGTNGSRTPETPNPRPRSASDLFVRLYMACTLKEKQILIAIAGRIGIEYEDWLPEEEVEEKTNEGKSPQA